MHVLVIEDDVLLAEGIQVALRKAAFTVDWIRDGVQALAALRDAHFDVIVLDLGLPRMDGLRVLKEARRSGCEVPVLILTARDAVNERVRALDLGADDFLGKPFDATELCARLRALHRRARGRCDDRIVFNDIVLSPSTHECRWHGTLIDLSRREFTLLQLLLEDRGRVLTRKSLMHGLYGFDEDFDSTNAIEVHIHRLRRKLYQDIVTTVRGVGYIVHEPVAAA